MAIVERYHYPIRRAYNIIGNKAPDASEYLALQILIKDNYEFVSRDGLVPILLVYYSLPQLGLSYSPPTLSAVFQPTTLQKAVVAESKRFVNRLVWNSIFTQNKTAF